MSQFICYEQPLNERVRSLLRLEFLFQQMNHALAGHSTWDSRAALLGLFDILKSELLKEMERHAAALNRLRENPGVDSATLSAVLAEISLTIGLIHRLDSQALDAVRQTDFLGAIQMRSQVPGGTCRFDLPALYHWLQQDSSTRAQHLQAWSAPFGPMQEAVALVLRLIRSSAVPQPEMAVRGFFQRGLDPNAPNQLIRVLLPPGGTLFPEISGGRHRFAIRFLDQPDPNRRATQSEADVQFELACCAI